MGNAGHKAPRLTKKKYAIHPQNRFGSCSCMMGCAHAGGLKARPRIDEHDAAGLEVRGLGDP
jgi:hypothetical protein